MDRTKLSDRVACDEKLSRGTSKRKRCKICDIDYVVDLASGMPEKSMKNKCGVCAWQRRKLRVVIRQEKLRRADVTTDEARRKQLANPKNWIECDICLRSTLCTKFHPLPCNRCGLNFCHACTGFLGVGCHACNPYPIPKNSLSREEVAYILDH
jgi:hypothetical protein